MSKRNGMKNDPTREEIGNTFRSRLKTQMAMKGLTSLSLAKKLGDGWNPANIDDYINTKKEPSFFTIAAIAKTIGLSCDYLAGLVDEPTSTVDKATALRLLGLSGISEKAITNLSELLSLEGFWRRSVASCVLAQNRWSIDEKDAEVAIEKYWGDFESGFILIRNYELYKLTVREFFSSILSEDEILAILKKLLRDSLMYVELFEAYDYVLRLRSEEKNAIDQKTSLAKRLNNEYDNIPGLERTSFDKEGHDSQLSDIKNRQVVQKAIIHEDINELLILFYKKHIKTSVLSTHERKAKDAIEDSEKWIEEAIQWTKEMEEERLWEEEQRAGYWESLAAEALAEGGYYYEQEDYDQEDYDQEEADNMRGRIDG